MDTTRVANEARKAAQGGLEETALELKETGQEWSEKARSTARDAGAAADLYLHEYAWTSAIAIAAVAGIIGYWLGTQRR